MPIFNGYRSRLGRTRSSASPSLTAPTPTQRRISAGASSIPLFQSRTGIDLSGNGNLNLNTSLDVDDDLLNGLGGGEEAIEPLAFCSIITPRHAAQGNVDIGVHTR